jgi:GT2 family glycosyltransferase
LNNLTVIIPSKNHVNLSQCIGAVRTAGETCRIIVVDDGINLPELTRSAKNGSLKNVKIIEGKKPFVFARNCNIGIREAGEDDVILLNDDALLKSKNGFTLLQKEAEAHSEYGCIGAVTNVTGQIMQKPMKKGLRSLHNIAFVCVLIPRKTIDKIGLLDERYCLDYGVEDRDYCEEILLAGLQVGVHDGCYVDHASLVSSYRGSPMAHGRSDKNRALFLEKFKRKNYFKW